MMAGVRGWLLALISVSLICALADALTPKGAVKRVVRLVCGLTLVCAVLSPLGTLDLEQSQRWLEGQLRSTQLERAALEQEVDEQMKVIIEREYAAYIVDKAAQLGAVCSARVACREEDGVLLPLRAEVEGAVSQPVRKELVRALVQDLGLSEEEIYFKEEEVP